MEQPPAALRKAIGQQLMEQALGRKPSAAPDGGGAHAGVQRSDSLPADVRSFGALLDSARANLLPILFVVTQASSLVLMKASLLELAAPAVLTALHQAAAVAGLAAAAGAGLLEHPTLTGFAVRGASVQAAIAGVQLLALMATLNYGSVFLLLCWMAVAPQVLAVLLEHQLQRRWPPPQLLLLVAFALVGAVAEFVFDHHKSAAALLMLALWAASKAAEFAWRLLRADATAGGRIADHEFLYHCRSIADGEEAQGPGALVLLQNLLPAGPCLLLGLLVMEGRELAEHEPSVPALTVLLLSCAAYAGAVVLQALLRGQATVEGWQLLTGAAWLLAICLDFLERSHEMGARPLLATLAAVGGGLAAGLVAYGRASGRGARGALGALAVLTTQPVVAASGRTAAAAHHHQGPQPPGQLPGASPLKGAAAAAQRRHRASGPGGDEEAGGGWLDGSGGGGGSDGGGGGGGSDGGGGGGGRALGEAQRLAARSVPMLGVLVDGGGGPGDDDKDQ
ncbi:MAG: hypothetical protein J3K34DRAFT_524914 [Monoraphidium minutum]|nr:MAG: hypothetical protein J3K34DRAFT_524914 [Monoraphidium minutum]